MWRSDALVRKLDKLGERALYSDTENVILVQKNGELPLVQCGDALGNMTSELQDEYIFNFLAGVLRSMLINYVIL